MLSVEGGYREAKYGEESARKEDKSNGGGAGLEWTIVKPLLLSVDGYYTETEYDPDDREDELYDGNCKLALNLYEHFFIETRYQYLENRSIDKKTQRHLEDNEYVDNRYSIGLRAVF